MTTVCTAPHHGRRHAYGPNRCNCPSAVSRRRHRRRYIPGRASNRRGPRYGVDPVAVDRAVDGDQSLRLTVAERHEAIARLTRQGWSAARIAVHLGCTPRTVCRHRHRAREAS